jgi:hypothetical protein
MTHLKCVREEWVGCWLVRRLWVGVAGLAPHDAVAGAAITGALGQITVVKQEAWVSLRVCTCALDAIIPQVRSSSEWLAGCGEV